MDRNRVIIAFDLDGTITNKEILPILAKELDLEEKITKLTKLTLSGKIDFEESFRLRVKMLSNIPVSKVQEIVSYVPLNNHIENFIKSNKEKCVIVTGNLDVWIKPITDRLGCKVYSSEGIVKDNTIVKVKNVLIKDKAIKKIRKYSNNVIAIGESYNDLPMFQESDIGIAYGGVHNPVTKLIQNSNFVVYRGDILCKLLNMLL